LGVRFQAGGPAQYAQACKLSRKLFVDNLNIYLVSGISWDILRQINQKEKYENRQKKRSGQVL
jgi:hypothetical protein